MQHAKTQIEQHGKFKWHASTYHLPGHMTQNREEVVVLVVEEKQTDVFLHRTDT